MTWVFGEGGGSEVVVRLAPGSAGDTEFHLEHSGVDDPGHWVEFGPGAVGVGWDLTLLGLSMHLAGEAIGDPVAWMRTPKAREFMVGSSQAWGAAHESVGATRAEAATAARNTSNAYAPDPNGATRTATGSNPAR